MPASPACPSCKPGELSEPQWGARGGCLLPPRVEPQYRSQNEIFRLSAWSGWSGPCFDQSRVQRSTLPRTTGSPTIACQRPRSATSMRSKCVNVSLPWTLSFTRQQL
jgi:hypothetical protein